MKELTRAELWPINADDRLTAGMQITNIHCDCGRFLFADRNYRGIQWKCSCGFEDSIEWTCGGLKGKQND